jgi:hypothetical protein
MPQCEWCGECEDDSAGEDQQTQQIVEDFSEDEEFADKVEIKEVGSHWLCSYCRDNKCVELTKFSESGMYQKETAKYHNFIVKRKREAFEKATEELKEAEDASRAFYERQQAKLKKKKEESQKPKEEEGVTEPPKKKAKTSDVADAGGDDDED